jgi:hypothetical protein
LSLVFLYNKTVLYFPVLEGLKRKQPRIDLNNSDHQGGLGKYYDFLWRTFFYNEGLVVIILTIFKFNLTWWIYIPFIFILIKRCNHAGWSIVAYITSLVRFTKVKKKAKEQLFVSDDTDAF